LYIISKNNPVKTALIYHWQIEINRAMKKHLFLLVVFISFNAAAGLAQITFHKTYGGTAEDGCNAVIQTSDGGYALAGYTRSFGAGGYDFYMVKTDANGNLQWTKTIGGTGDEKCYSIVQTTDGGYVLCGRYANGSDLNLYIIKLNSYGSLTWTRTVAAASLSAIGYSILQTSDGGYLTGGTYYMQNNDFDFFVVKLDVSGTLQWSKTISGGISGYADAIYSMVQTSDGGYFVGGNTLNAISPGSHYLSFAKMDNSGNLQWSKTSGNGKEGCNSVIQAADGGYCIAGVTNIFGGGASDIYIMKTDNLGTIQWTKTFGGVFEDEALSIVRSTDGGFLIAGQSSSGTNSSCFLTKMDLNGNPKWTRTIGGNYYDYAYSVINTADGGIALGGYTNNGLGNNDFLLIKLDSAGNGCDSSSTIGVSGNGGLVNAGGIVTGTNSGAIGSAGIEGTGGTESTLCSTVGINNLPDENNMIHFFPNPFSTQTTLQTDIFLKDAAVTVYNTFGEEVRSFVISHSPFVIERNGLPSGMYFIRLMQGNKIVATNKFVVTDH